MPALVVLGALLVVFGLFAIVFIVASRRAHLRSWRFGVFYEAEDRYGDDKGDDDAR